MLFVKPKQTMTKRSSIASSSLHLLKSMLCSFPSRFQRAIVLLLNQTNPFSSKPFNTLSISNNNTFRTNDSIEFDHATVRETISSYSNDWKSAFEFFNWVETNSSFLHNTDTYNFMLDVLGKFFEFDLCWNLIQRMKDHQFSHPNHTTFRIMFKRYLSAHLVQETIDIYNNRTPQFNLKDETSLSNLIDALCEYKHVVEAYELLFKTCSDCKINTKFCNMILRGWSKIGWWSKCREFWEEMGKMGIDRDLYSYSICMDIQCKCNKPWKAVKLYKLMKKEGIQLDVPAYNTVINAVGLCEGVDMAIRVYRDMKESRCEPNVVTYNTIIKLLCKYERFKEAYLMLEEMPKRGCEPNVITYHCFFGLLMKPKEILRLFERMIDSGLQPRMDTYVMLMRKFSRWGFLRPVFLVWKKMEELGCSPDEFAYNALIDALVQKGMVDMARKYDEEMLAKGLSAKPRVELGTKLVDKHVD